MSSENRVKKFQSCRVTRTKNSLVEILAQIIFSQNSAHKKIGPKKFLPLKFYRKIILYLKILPQKLLTKKLYGQKFYRKIVKLIILPKHHVKKILELQISLNKNFFGQKFQQKYFSQNSASKKNLGPKIVPKIVPKILAPKIPPKKNFKAENCPENPREKNLGPTILKKNSRNKIFTGKTREKNSRAEDFSE